MSSGKLLPSSADPADHPVFAAVITPHRSLGPQAFRLVMTLICLASVVSSIPFLVLGAWPIAGFFGLDLVALYIAFRVNFRSGRCVEEVVLTRIELLLSRRSASGAKREWRFNPLWSKLDREDDDEFGLMKLAVVSRGERVVIAQDLSPGERESLADAFGKALAEVKRGF
jgi:uncharacterized membrane protein